MATAEQINEAFRDLRRQGFFAEADFCCCQSCAWYQIDNSEDCEPEENVVFYHEQDAEDLDESGECHLAWRGDSAAIVKAMQKHGLTVEWDGSKDSRILVK